MKHEIERRAFEARPAVLPGEHHGDEPASKYVRSRAPGGIEWGPVWTVLIVIGIIAAVVAVNLRTAPAPQRPPPATARQDEPLEVTVSADGSTAWVVTMNGRLLYVRDGKAIEVPLPPESATAGR